MKKFLQSPKPVNDSELAFLLRELYECCQNKLPIKSVPGRYTVDYTDGGQVLNFQTGGGGGSGSISGSIRGEYNSAVDYMAGDIVRVEGANAGAYGCVKDHPGAGNAPWVGGGYWITLWRDNLGAWM